MKQLARHVSTFTSSSAILFQANPSSSNDMDGDGTELVEAYGEDIASLLLTSDYLFKFIVIGGFALLT
jgi:hypothetical protein